MPHSLPDYHGHPLPAALRALNAEQGERFAAEMLLRLPAGINALTAEARNQAESAAVESLKAQLRPQRGALQQRFVTELQSRSDPLRKARKPRVLDFERLACPPGEEREDQQVTASLARSFAEVPGYEPVRQRLHQAAKALNLPLLAEAMVSATPCAAFLASLRVLGVSAEGRLLALRPFETQGLRLWGDWLAAVKALLESPSMALPLLPSRPAEEDPPCLSATAELQLQRAAQTKEGGADAELASELLRIVEEQEKACASIVAVQRWFDGLCAEAQLPGKFQADMESLRMGLARAALSDSSFFTQEKHPLRERVSSLSVQAALTQPGLAVAALVRAEIRGFALKLGEAASNREMLANLCDWPSPPPEALRAFALNQPHEMQHRLARLLNRVREAALDAVDWAALPPHQQGFAAAGLAPLLSAAWLRDGTGTAAHRAAQALIAQWQQTSRANSNTADRSSLAQALQLTWTSLGADAQRIQTLLGALQASYQPLTQVTTLDDEAYDPDQEIDALLASLEAGGVSLPIAPEAPELPKATAAPDTAQEQVARMSELFAHGRWLRVPNPAGDGARFLSIASFEPRQKMVMLVTATGETALNRAADSLLDELFTGKAEFLSPDEKTQGLMERLKAGKLSSLGAPN